MPSRCLVVGGAVLGLVGALGLLAPPAHAQTVDPHAARPERPTVATHAFTVAPGWFEIETGVERDRTGGATTLLAPAVLKLGLAPRVQLGVVLGAIRLPEGPDRGATAGVGDASVDLKWRASDDAGVLGAFAVQGSVKLPAGSARRGTGTGTTDASLLLISSHELAGVALDFNAGATRRTGDGSHAPRASTIWTASAGLPVTEALGWVVELFGYPGTSGVAGTAPIVAALTGPTWTVRPSLVLDVGVITPVAGPQPRALYAGLTWNVGRAW